MRTALACAAIAVVSLSLPAAAQSNPQEISTIFCDGRMSGDMTAVEPLLSPDLKAAIAEAEARNAEIQAANPNEKPPLGDGIPWASYQDAPPQCEMVGMSGTAEAAEIVLFYRFPEQRSANFSDRLVVRFVDDELKIDDVRYQTGGTLRETLAGAFE